MYKNELNSVKIRVVSQHRCLQVWALTPIALFLLGTTAKVSVILSVFLGRVVIARGHFCFANSGLLTRLVKWLVLRFWYYDPPTFICPPFTYHQKGEFD